MAARFAMLFLAGLAIVSCGAMPVSQRVADRAKAGLELALQRHMSLELYLERQARLHTVGWNLRSSNADVCGRWSRGIGVMTLDTEALPAGLRVAAESRFGRGLLVGSVAPYSPATGMLHPGDEIVGVNGTRTGSEEDFRGQLSGAQSDVVRVDVVRARTVKKVLLIPVPVCRWPVNVVEAPGVTAWTDGRSISITAGMMRFAAGDDALAQVVGHELAHAVLGHNERRLFADRTDEELEADRLGVVMAGRAGYNIDRAPEFWRLVSQENVYHGVESWRRFRALKEAVEQFRKSGRARFGGAAQ